jgi:hypothetical protein
MKAAIEQAGSPMELRIELNLAATKAFEARPIDDRMLRAVFASARSCWEAPDGDVSTAVVVAFFEDIVKSPAARADLHRWISQAEFDGLKGPFRYHLSAEEFADFERDFRKRSKQV